MTMQSWSLGICSPTHPYVVPYITKIHTPIALGIRFRAKLLVFQLRKRRPCGFDSHRPLHFQDRSGDVGIPNWGQHVDLVGKSWERTFIWRRPRVLTYPQVAPAFTRTVTRRAFQE